MKFKIFISIIFALIAFAGWFFGGDRNTDKITASQEQKTSSISTISPASAQTKKYENIKYGFSFNYPTDFTLGEFPEDESGVSLIIQNVKTNQVVQIYITPYDDPDFAVSAERPDRRSVVCRWRVVFPSHRFRQRRGIAGRDYKVVGIQIK